MQLSVFLTEQTIGAMRQVSQQAPKAQYLTAPARGVVCAIVGRKATSDDFWSRFDAAYRGEESIIVVSSHEGTRVLTVTTNPTFAKQVGIFLKRGDKLCWVHGKSVVTITWDNWKRVYQQLSATLTESQASCPSAMSHREYSRIQEEKRREKVFYEAASCNRIKKLGKRGFNTTFDELRAAHRSEEYEKRLRNIKNEARRILAVL